MPRGERDNAELMPAVDAAEPCPDPRSASPGQHSFGLLRAHGCPLLRRIALSWQEPSHLESHRPLPPPTSPGAAHSLRLIQGFRRLVLLPKVGVCLCGQGVGCSLFSAVYAPSASPLVDQAKARFYLRLHICLASSPLWKQFSLKSAPSINYMFPNP